MFDLLKIFSDAAIKHKQKETCSYALRHIILSSPNVCVCMHACLAHTLPDDAQLEVGCGLPGLGEVRSWAYHRFGLHRRSLQILVMST